MMGGWVGEASLRSLLAVGVSPRPSSLGWCVCVSPSLLRARVDSRPTRFKEFFYPKKGNKVENIFPLTVPELLLQAGTSRIRVK